MSGPEIGLAVSVFLACAVEAVEALTILLAVGTTRSWSSTVSGAAGATALYTPAKRRASQAAQAQAGVSAIR